MINGLTSYSQIRYDTLLLSSESKIYEVAEYSQGVKIAKTRYANDTLILNTVFSKEDSFDYDIFQYFGNGEIKAYNKYKDNLAEGEQYEKYESGKYRVKGFCHRDTCYDTTYNENEIMTKIRLGINGNLIYEVNYCNNGFIESIYRYGVGVYKFTQFYCDSKKPVLIGKFKDEVNIGKWKTFDEKGNVGLIEYYTNKVVPRPNHMPLPVLLKTKEYHFKKLYSITYYDGNLVKKVKKIERNKN